MCPFVTRCKILARIRSTWAPKRIHTTKTRDTQAQHSPVARQFPTPRAAVAGARVGAQGARLQGPRRGAPSSAAAHRAPARRTQSKLQQPAARPSAAASAATAHALRRRIAPRRAAVPFPDATARAAAPETRPSHVPRPRPLDSALSHHLARQRPPPSLLPFSSSVP